MKNEIKRVNKKRKGFTLIELVVVIIIIGILAAAAIPRFSAMTQTANLSTFESNHRMIVSSISMYMAEHVGQYPADNAALNEYITTADGKDAAGAVQPNGMDAIQGKPDSAIYTVVDGVLTSEIDIDVVGKPASPNSTKYVIKFTP